MKRSIAFLLAVVMCIGMIPATLLPVLAHGMGVGIDNVENLSINNAPNQKIPATVTLDGENNDTAWVNDEWQLADAQEGIWDVVGAKNPNFAYRYQLHIDYEFVYGIIEVDKKANSLVDGTLTDMTVWLNDGVSEGYQNHYTAKIVITPNGNDYKIAMYRYGGEDVTTKFASYKYEYATVESTENNGILTLEFKGLISAILGKKTEEKTKVNLTSFVSANINTSAGAQYFYHPRVDAEQDAKNINLKDAWPEGAEEITQTMLYDVNGNPETSNKLDVDKVDYITVDGHLDEEAWKEFTNYGGSGFETYKDYTRFTEGGHKIGNYDVEYSTEYMYHDGDNRLANNEDVKNGYTFGEPIPNDYADQWLHYHVDNVDFKEHPQKSDGNVIYTPGCWSGVIWPGSKGTYGAQKEHVCTAQCQLNYLNNVPVKFKYNFKSDGSNIYGAVVVDLNMYNTTFYNTGKLDTYFKVMIAGKASPTASNPWTAFTQLELKHTLDSKANSAFADGSKNHRVITANSDIGKNDKTDNYGNTILPAGVGAYARRLDTNTMVFEFCISYDQLNANLRGDSKGDYQFKNGDEVSVIITVGNDTSSSSSTGPANVNSFPYAVHASNANWFGHAGNYDVLGRETNHRYILGANDPKFTTGMANGILEDGIFNGLRAHDRFINSAQRNVLTANASNQLYYGEGGKYFSAPGPMEFFDYEVFMSSEYLYGAAIIKKNGYTETSTTKETAIDKDDMFRIWINNGTAQWRDQYDYVVNFRLDPTYSNPISISRNAALSDYVSNGTNNYDGTNLEKGTESFGTSIEGIVYKSQILSSSEYTGIGSNSSLYPDNNDPGGDIAIVEFKIPLELLGITEKYTEKINAKGDDIALSYYVSVNGTTSGSDGIYAPIPDNRNLNRGGSTTLNYGIEKEILLNFKENNVTEGGWTAGSLDGVNGARIVKTKNRTNQFVIDGILDEVIWNDEEERIWVNSSTGSWGNEPDVPHMFDYQHVVYTGREYIYGAAQINTAAGENEDLIYTLWINNNGGNKASKKFSIVQKGDHAVCYDMDGNELALTRDVETWDSSHEETFTLRYTDGMVAMTNANGITYVEFMLSLEGMGVTTHVNNDPNAFTQFMSNKNDGSGPWLPASDKFYYTRTSGTTFALNKQNGFEYFVSVTKMDNDCGHSNTLYYPAPKTDAPTAITATDKFCHLADNSSYNSVSRWDAENDHVITALDYFLPETVTIDGDLSDSGWRDDMWIDVKQGVNGNLQNPVEDMQGASIAEYKFQMRADDEYIYVAAVVDHPASPIRYNVYDNGVHYSVPRVRLWIQSKDEDYEITVNHNGLKVNGSTQATYKYNEENLYSFTHLYDVTLGYDSKTGELSNQQLTVTPEVYNPETYVTWQDNNVPHVTADKLTKLNDSLKPSALTVTGSTLRYAVNHTGFFAPYGGNARKTTDPVGILSYKIKGVNDDFVQNPNRITVHNYYDYAATDFYGVTEVIEENTVTAKGETAYTDKDWYAKPEIKKYVYANEHAVMTSDETGTKTIVEFRVPLADFGCEDGDDFEYFIQGGDDGVRTDTGYVLFYPPISYGFSKETAYEAEKTSGRPYWYWATTGKLVDDAERERIRLRNNFEPVTPIGAQYRLGTYEGFGSDEYLGIKFGMLYDADYMRQPANLSTDIYQNAKYWDLKEIGMMIGYTDYLDANVENLTSDCADDYNIYRIESDVILNHVQNTNMADYESYIFYTTMLLWPDEYDTKLTYRGYVDYYPSDHIYYNMAWKTFSKDYPWTYSTPESNGKYLGKPLALAGVNGDPTKIPQTYTYRPTFYSDPVTRNVNMIRYADDSLKEELPGNRVEVPVEKPNAQGSKILYVPIDDRPINLERVQYQAEAAGFTIVTPPAEYITTKIDTYKEGKSDQGNPKDLYTWLENQFDSGEYSYYIISVDQMFSGGLVGSREPFYDTGDTIANTSILSGYNTENGGYTLSEDETKMVALLKKIAASDASTAIFFDTIKRLASTQDYFAMNSTNYGAFRMYGTFARPQLYGSELTVDNIIKGYNKNSDGTPIAQPLSSAPQAAKDALSGSFNVNTDYYFTYYVNSSGDEITHDVPADKTGLTLKYAGLDVEGYKMYMAARERKLKIANALYSDDATYASIAKTADALYIGYDDSKPVVTMQTNDGRYIEEKLIAGCDNSYVFSGTDELGMMAVAKLTTGLYGEVSANAVFFGIGKDEPGDAYDIGTLYDNVMVHINGIGAKYSYDNTGDIDVLILTRSDHYDHDSFKTEAKYSSTDLEQLRIYAGQLIDRVDANLKAGKPTVVVDCAFKDDYLAAMLMQRYATSYHTADVSNRLNQLLAYSQWNTTANSLGTAISNGVSRYAYLKNCAPEGITEASHIAANKVNVKAWVKDYGYQSSEVDNSNLSRTKPFNGESDFATTYNNFWEINKYIMAKINASSVATGVKADGSLNIPAENAYQSSVSNLWWRWDRRFEANFDIEVVPKTEFTPVNYDDYKVVNLALGRSYTATITPSTSYPDSGEELTDGIVYYQNEPGKVSYSHPAWVGYDTHNGGTDAAGNKYVDVVIDLGARYDVYQASAQLLNTGDGGVRVPKYVQLYTSIDNDTFTLQRTIQTSGLTGAAPTVYLGTDMTSVKARYVKLRFANAGAWVMPAEITVLGLDSNRPEYIDSNGLYFSYTIPDGNTTYIRADGTPGSSNYKAYMTADDGARLRWYKYDTGRSANMYNPTELYTEYSKEYHSGWNCASGKPMNIDITVPMNVFITQIAVLKPTNHEGWSTPADIKLSYEDENGKFVELDTNLFIIKYIDKSKYGTRFDGNRCVVEIKDGLVLPNGKKLRISIYRQNMGAELLAGIQVIGRNANYRVSIDGASVDYQFMGDHASDAGFAQGMVTITPTSTKTDGYYHVYYVNNNGPLAEYDALASIPMTGRTVSYEIPDGTLLPYGATGIAVFESDKAFEDTAPDMSRAVAVAEIPANKQTGDLGVPEATFGVASDMHMNYEYYGNRSAQAKWKNALNFLDGKGAEYVIVTGDMTGDEAEQGKTLKQQYDDYFNVINNSNVSATDVYEAMGNHGNTSAGLSEFARTFGADEVHPYTNSPYYYVLKEGENGEKDNIFIFMWMEMGETSAISTKNVFSAEQIDWLEGLLNTYDNDQTNVFVICHSPFLNYGAGDRYKGGGYTNVIDADQPKVYPQNSELKFLLQQHKDVIVMSGHTHLTLYDGANYSDVNNEFAHTVHVPSVCWPRAYTADGSSCPAGTDGRYSADTATYGSEAYLVRVFDDYIVYVGYNLSTGKIIPAACIIIPTDRGEAPTPDDIFEGSGTKDDPYLIQDAQDFLLLTSGFSNDAYNGKNADTGYGAGKYFLQTANIDLSDIDAYMGTYAGSAKDTVLNAHQPAFAGIYNGNGYTITVDIDGLGSRSIFPYLYGTVANLKIEGSITGTLHANSGGAAMPIARVRDGANVVNCYFDLDLTANETFGVSKGAAANGNIYNVYATGSLTGNSKHAMTSNNVIKNGNAYYYYDGTFTNTIGTKKTAEEVATAFNNTSSAAYTTAKSILDAYGIALHKVAADNGGLIFQ